MGKRYYKGEYGNIGPSPALWAECPIEDILVDPNAGYYLWDDFMQFLEATGGWVAAGTNETCVVPADEVGGVVRIGCTGADLDECYLTSGNNEGGCCRIYVAAPQELWFEARVRFTSLTETAVFCGLAQQALAAADTLADNTGALSAASFVGFHADCAAPTLLDAVYMDAAGAAIVTKAAAQTVAITTWYKLGLHYKAPFLNWYVDGVREPLTAAVTGVEVNKGLRVGSATTFPDADYLAILFGVKDGEAAAGHVKSLDIDWVRLAQRR